MSDTLLPEPGDPSGIEAAVGCLDDLARLFVERTAQLVSIVLRYAEREKQVWLSCVKAVAAGETERIHARRDSLRAELLKRLEEVRQATRLAGMAQNLNGGIPGSERLPAAIADLERLRVEVYDRWQTTEDLEELAVKWYPLSAERLEELARTYRPPASWYQEEDKVY